MYIINDTYFQSPKREVSNLNEPDSKTFAEIQLLIDEKCRLLLLDFLTVEQFQELDGYLVNGIFPENAQPDPLLPNYVPQKWIDLVKGCTYQASDVDLIWKGLTYSLGTSKHSLLADYVYYFWLESQVSYMTGVGDAKGNPKGAFLVNPTQRIVTVWNEFVKHYQNNLPSYRGSLYGNYYPVYPYNGCVGYYQHYKNQEVSLIQFLSDNEEQYPNDNRKFFEIKNQLGL